VIEPEGDVGPVIDQEELEAPPEEPMLLLYRNEQGDRGTLTLTGRKLVRIGREADCELVFHDAHVSRHHAAIELVEGQHLLRDGGSANGTYLNGLRLSRSHSFALRAGDVIEIGSERMHYVRPGDDCETPRAGLDRQELAAATHDFADLVKDGLETLDARERVALNSAVLGAFNGVQSTQGIERVLARILDQVHVDTVAFFVEDPRHGLRTLAALPSLDSAGTLIQVALRCVRDARGHIARGHTPAPEDFERTTFHSQSSSAAVPVLEHGRTRGILAIERLKSARLTRADLARLAVMADAISKALAVRSAVDAMGETAT
jgi:hypothetical protein